MSNWSMNNKDDVWHQAWDVVCDVTKYLYSKGLPEKSKDNRLAYLDYEGGLMKASEDIVIIMDQVVQDS